MEEEYFKRYNEIKDLLLLAYMDIFSLQEIDKYNGDVINDKGVLTKSTHIVCEHICWLLKNDLALILWKIYFDENKKANTIRHLLSYIKSNCNDKTEDINLPKITLPRNLLETQRQLILLRRECIAHNDATKTHAVVTRTELTELADFFCEVLNGLCIAEIDKRVEPISPQCKLKLQYNVSLGLGLMIKRSTVQNYPIEVK